MPAPGEQHLGRAITNPFEEKTPRMSEYTAQEIATLQSRLEKQLGPEYISSRSGPGGGKVHYVAAEKCIQLANEVFGFNGWSSQIMDIQVDFVDENPTTLKVSLGLSVIMRVTLRDGTFHEDIGYGHIENCKGKAAAFEKAKKEGTTDGLKRALRNFGNVLGNCIYDKEYLAKVTKIKVQPGKWDVANLHRHADHTTKPQVARIEEKPQVNIQSVSQNIGAAASIDADDTLVDDEFGEFDEADFSVPDPDAHPDEVVLPASGVASRHFGPGGWDTSTANTPVTNPNRPPVNPMIPNNRPQQPMRPPNLVQGVPNAMPAQPQTPNNGFSKPVIGPGASMKPPPQDPGQARVLNQPSRAALNQPSRVTAPLSAPASPAHLVKPSSLDSDDDISVGPLPPGLGFFSARAAANIPEGSKDEPLPLNAANRAAFNPHAESPSIPKTPGVDHTKSKPLTRGLKHVAAPSSSQAANATTPGTRPNVLNPQMDAVRRIGAPGGGSPMANRGGFRPPGLKRPVDGNLYPPSRAPLNDLPANGTVGQADGSDMKRQRLGG